MNKCWPWFLGQAVQVYINSVEKADQQVTSQCLKFLGRMQNVTEKQKKKIWATDPSGWNKILLKNFNITKYERYLWKYKYYKSNQNYTLSQK